jgi:hypothetical protein
VVAADSAVVGALAEAALVAAAQAAVGKVLFTRRA